MRLVVLTALCLLITHSAPGQNQARPDVDLQALVDEILAIQDDDINYEELYENLAQLLSDPADINQITAEQLRSLYILNERQVHAFINYRTEIGLFLSVYELQNVEGITKEVFEKISPFITVIDPASRVNKSLWHRMMGASNRYLVVRVDRTLEQKRGYREKMYAGSPNRMYTRFRASKPGDFSIGLTTEKDGGEKTTWTPSQKQYGADFISYHVQLQNKGIFKNIIVGDYQAQFGQGLTLGSAFGIGKNAEAVTTIRRPNIGFLPYTSVNEAGFFRGTAVSLSINQRITFHTMYSLRLRDGALEQDTTQEAGALASSFSYSGLHRTENELTNRNSIRENNLAGALIYQYKSLEAGLILHHTQFSTPLIRTPRVYNQFYFQGDRITNGGAFLNYNFKNFSFFSEYAHTLGEGTGITAGIVASFTSRLDMTLLYRKYDRNFQSLYSNALSENSSAQNERGIYWGWKYLFSKQYSLSGYFDMFKFPWLRYRSYMPSYGDEWLIRITYKPSRSVSMFLQAREETKVRNISSESNLYVTAPGIKRNYWINIDYTVTTGLSFRTRAQFSRYALGTNISQGMVILHDVTWQRGKISISGRYALFNTDDYDNRLYVYEKDAWLAFSFPPYFGTGVRNYIVLQYSVSRTIDIWLRWARVTYRDRTSIGSGNELIEGNDRNDVKFQTRIRF